MNSVSAGSRSRTASAKSVPSTLETKRNVMRAVAVMLQRLVGHDRPEVGAADADIDDVANALAGVAFPFAAANAVARIRAILSSTAWTPRHDVLAVDEMDSPSGARSATCRTARFSVTLIFSPPNMASIRCAQARFLGQLQQQADGFVGDAVLRVIEVDAGGLDASVARRAWGRQRIAGADAIRRIFSIMGLQSLPRFALREWLWGARRGAWCCR